MPDGGWLIESSTDGTRPKIELEVTGDDVDSIVVLAPWAQSPYTNDRVEGLLKTTAPTVDRPRFNRTGADPVVVQRRPGGRGFTLVEVIISGVILVICAGVLLTLTSQALSMHRRGEEKVVAAALLDELLGRVLTEGAEDFGLIYSNQGPCDAPFQNWEYSVDIDNAVGSILQGERRGHESDRQPYECATLVAPAGRGSESSPVPEEPVDRENAGPRSTR